MCLLWALIGTVRIVLTWGLTTGGLSPKAVSILTLAFLPVLLTIEGLILLRAAREFIAKPVAREEIWKSAGGLLGKFDHRFRQIFTGLLLLVLPFALWDARLDPVATPPTLVGSAINLLFVSALASGIAAYKKRSGQEGPND
jgi:hypothetical protein